MAHPYRPLKLALWGLLGFAVVFVLFGAAGWGPAAANEQPIGAVSRWCERVSGGLLREPVNTLGNLGFVVAGLAMFATLARDEVLGRKTNRFFGHTPVALVYASAVTFLGPGSMVMHGSHTFFGAWVDNLSMVVYILVPWLFNVATLGRWTDRAAGTVYGSLLAVYALGYWFFGEDLGIGLDLFGVSIGLWVVSEVLYRWWSRLMRALSGLAGFGVAAVFGIFPAQMMAAPGEYWWVVFFWAPGLLAGHPAPGRRRYVPWFWVGISSFLVAYAIWLTGTGEDPACRPDSWLQAHALWHLLSAGATWGFFAYFRTERPTAPAQDQLRSSGGSATIPS